jgi:glycosyltransferase involved in cell wall biosynthesis
MRILLLPYSYPPVLGGLQIAVHSLARAWQSDGQTVLVVTNHYPRQLPSEEILDGVQVKRMPFLYPDWQMVRRKRLDLFTAGLMYYPLVTRKLVRFIREFQPEVVNVHFPDEQSAHVLALHQKHPFKLVISLHGHEIQRWVADIPKQESIYSLSSKQRLVKLLQVADRVTACSQHLLEQASRLEISILQKGQVIHNGIDLKRFEDCSCYPHPRPYLFAWGRLTHVKGFDLLIEAFRQISAKYPELDMILAGAGKDRSSLEDQVKQLHLEERVVFFGQANPEEVVHLLNGCLIAVIPSRQESFGITALEAMAAGKPVLVTRVGGIPEFLPDEGNLMVEPSTNELALGLFRLIANAAADIPSNRTRAADFSWERSARKYLETFR